MVRQKVPDTEEHMQNLFLWYEANNKMDLRHDYPLSQDSVIFDLGAYLGQWSQKIWDRYQCYIYAFEPVKQFYEQARESLKHDKVTVFNYAIGNSDRTEDITFIKDGSTFFVDGDKLEHVEVRDIVRVMKDLNVPKVHLIKMNVEGSEYEILERLIDLNMLSMFDNLQIQFHREVDNYQERRKKIHEALKRTHKCLYNYELIWESWKIQ